MLSRIHFDPALPVSERRKEIAESIAASQVTIACGETGSGKTTQLPKILLEMGRGENKQIGHTQPRTIAARSVAARIAEELKVELGTLETQGDPDLRAYGTIILDEAHERSLRAY